jgi:hypothetical protein
MDKATQRFSRCQHYRGVFGQPICSAGVDVVERTGPRKVPGWLNRIPCCTNPRSAPTWSCPSFVQEDEREWERLRKHTTALLNLFAGIKASPGESGEVVCPACGGRMRWAASRYNGHLHAACDTDECLSLME